MTPVDLDTDSWGTPDVILTAVRDVLGTIDLDPMSNDMAQRRVRAGRHYTKADNGLIQPWCGKVFANPPYGRGQMSPFVGKLLSEVGAAGDVSAAIALVNASTSTKWFQTMLKHAASICLLSRRLGHHHPTTDALTKGNRYDQAVFLYTDDPGELDTFCVVFGRLGSVLLCGQPSGSVFDRWRARRH